MIPSCSMRFRQLMAVESVSYLVLSSKFTYTVMNNQYFQIVVYFWWEIINFSNKTNVNLLHNLCAITYWENICRNVNALTFDSARQKRFSNQQHYEQFKYLVQQRAAVKQVAHTHIHVYMYKAWNVRELAYEYTRKSYEHTLAIWQNCTYIGAGVYSRKAHSLPIIENVWPR